MLDIAQTLKILNSYNINSHKYGPTIYQNNDKIGICLDIKDQTFGFLTRAFTFSDTIELENFLKQFFWHKNNGDKHNIYISLDNYSTKEPSIKYIYNNIELTIDNMLNFNAFLDQKKQQLNESEEKEYCLKNIDALTKYLIDFKKLKYNIKTEKNSLKLQENDLKFELLTNLTIYYGKDNNLEKKAVSLENNLPDQDIPLLENNAKNIANKPLEDIKNYLNSLIEITKLEELDEKNLINIYSNSVYKYNIEILNKQIEFVKNKISSEKNFNVKGSKIHNIDAELKSLLKSNVAPTNINVFLQDNRDRILTKFSKITNPLNAYETISGNNLNYSKKEIILSTPKQDIINDLNTKYNELDNAIKTNLILYNSIYKSICNFIVNNNYPEINIIKQNFDFNYYYNSIDEIVHNENNSHYLVKYFSRIKFTNLDSYITSLIEICKTLENTNFNIIDNLQVFNLSESNHYKLLTINPIYNDYEKVYLTTIPKNTSLIYIPEKIEIDEESKEIITTNSNNIYIKCNITDQNTTTNVHKYHKLDEPYNNSSIYITKDLILDKEIIFHNGTLEGA